MEAHAKRVELHEMNSELNQSSKKQRREGRMVEDGMFSVVVVGVLVTVAVALSNSCSGSNSIS